MTLLKSVSLCGYQEFWGFFEKKKMGEGEKRGATFLFHEKRGLHKREKLGLLSPDASKKSTKAKQGYRGIDV